MNINKLMKEMRSLMQKNDQLTNKLASEFFVGNAKNNHFSIEVKINGMFDPISILLDKNLLNNKYKIELENLIVNAFNNAHEIVDQNTKTTENQFNPEDKIINSLNKLLNGSLDNYQEKTNKIENEINTKFYANTNTDLINLTMSGNGKMISINIKDAILDEEEVDLLQDLIINSIKDIQAKIKKESELDMQNAFSKMIPKNFSK
ncbi:MAG: YbaB/EbfC family nucleoid-associated protein [Rickettsiales bacterium]